MSSISSHCLLACLHAAIIATHLLGCYKNHLHFLKGHSLLHFNYLDYITAEIMAFLIANRPFQINSCLNESETETRFVCDPMCQIRKICPLFGTLGHKQSSSLHLRHDFPIINTLFEMVYSDKDNYKLKEMYKYNYFLAYLFDSIFLAPF